MMDGMVESIARRGLERAWSRLARAGRRSCEAKLWLLAAMGACAVLLSGCGSFFGKVTTTTTTTTTTGSGDYLYVANANINLNTVAGFSLASGALSGTANSPYDLGVEPSTLAITPSNSILYAGSVTGGIYGYLVGSTGGLTLVGSGDLASASPAAMVVDSTGKWLLVMQIGLTNPSISAFPIDTSTGTLSNAASTVTLDAGTAESMVQVPNSNLLYASLGTSGVDAVTFDSSTGALAKLSFILNPKGSAYSDVGVATDPDGKFLFVTETGTNGVRSFTINTSTGIPTEVTGSPASAGSGVGGVLVDSTGTFLYAANLHDNTISAYTIASTGALTAITGSPFATGAGPLSLAEDKTHGYLAVACSGGTPDLQLFSISATTGALTSALTQSTGSVSPAGAYAVVASH
jgi:6-phosphogluconolactonase (cycloisomerase 2 family)